MDATRDFKSSFKMFPQSKIVKLRVQKKADKRNEDLLESDSSSGDDSGGGLWGSITKTFGADDGSAAAQAAASADEPLNIFCLASGHLYERLLKIMMLSTMRHTKQKVKFWILKNYLSPALKVSRLFPTKQFLLRLYDTHCPLSPHNLLNILRTH